MWNTVKRTLKILLGVALFVWLAFWLATNVAQPWLWMKQLGYGQVFWGVLAIKWPWVGLTLALVFGATWLNLRLADRTVAQLGDDEATKAGTARFAELPPRFRWWLSLVAAVALAWRGAVLVAPQWKTLFDFRWGGSFGQLEPIFGRDLGYYVFSLPFYQLVQRSFVKLLLVQLALLLVVYGYAGAIRLSRKQPWVTSRRVLGHLASHLVVGALVLAWGFYLARYALLYNTTGVVYGVGYTADHVQSVAFVVMALVSLAVAGTITVAFFKRRHALIAQTVLAGIAAYAVLVLALPALVQAYKVQPNELELETPYLKNNIALTRKAFHLEDVQVESYPASRALTPADLTANQAVIDNIRIWDARALLPTLRQTQEMRLYYQFYDADVDRYHLADGYHQVLVSARELAPTLPNKAQTWVNRHLQFTHGYGLVMNFDSQKEVEGLPKYVIDDIPPKSAYGLKIEQPAIYYGEMMPDFRIVGSGVKEFDYPKGKENVYASYQGKGGVPLSSFTRRLLFAMAQRDVNLLLSSYLGPNSRIQLWRRVRERVQAVAPFLALDSNPYAVLSGGKLYWIQDAYTLAPRFPYAEPRSSAIGRVSYIRNSVKAVVDAYDGTVGLYVADPEDPILAAYRRAFPEAFKPLTALSNDLREHLRYPKDLFAVQSDVFRAFHMTDPQVFYNQEDLWSYALRTRPKEEKKKDAWADPWAKPVVPDTLKPYYILTRLPGSRELEFLLMTSFTPQNRDNMVAWMAAKCDGPDYGQLVVYELPKEELSYGPAQVQAMINQNTVISQQLSLWDQKGSHVTTGELVAVPLADSFLYVQPVYLTAQSLNLPQLKRVIAVQGDRVVMAPTLEEAVEAVVGEERPSSDEVDTALPSSGSCPAANSQVRAAFANAERAMSAADWQRFGEAMSSLHLALASQALRERTTSPHTHNASK